ncbi:hypothetical protein ACE1ET_17565 [Saccharicrinis sp. FJH62]|uniref:hypothetical protein n=1 Tax=Saccharicrinis sp. FJH62 TaxID=3344657 RepID=UPI0035D49DA9
MKVFVFSLLICMPAILPASAQSNGLGLRAGLSFDNITLEGSFRHAFEKSQLEVDAGLLVCTRGAATDVFIAYHFVFPFKNKPGLCWYAGPGIGSGLYFNSAYAKPYESSEKHYFNGGGIQAGLNYTFDFPVQISFDTRDALYFDSYYDVVFLSNFALSVRYLFGR